MSYDEYGAGDMTLVLLHAFPLNREQWHAQGEALARHGGVRVIAPDLRGFGETELSDGPITVDQMAVDVFALMDSLRIERFVLGGLSLGGYVSFACMRLAPQRIQGLILADTKAEADTPEQREAREATAQFTLAHDAGALLNRDTPRLFWEQTISRRPDTVREARHIASENSAAGVAAVARGMALRPDSGPLLFSIRCPALIIVGEHDAITPPDVARAMSERISGSTLEVIPEAGHLSNLENPDAFTTALTRYLERAISR